MRALLTNETGAMAHESDRVVGLGSVSVVGDALRLRRREFPD